MFVTIRRRRHGVATAAVLLVLGMLVPGTSPLAKASDAAQPTGTSGFIQGTVTDTSGSSLSGATVQIRRQSDGALVEETSTDGSGDFGSIALPPDSYTVEATARFHDPFATDVVVNTNQTENVPIVLERGSGWLGGNVTDRNAAPIEGASVLVVDLRDGSVAAQLTSASDGSFGNVQLEAASYSVAIDHPDYVATSRTVTLDADQTRNVFAVLLRRQIFRDRFEETN